ncbi:beta transducin-like protein HET-D2Y [Penicillium canariense]|uniref:Mitochondrial division protein 1 n=1 Tax=Penicillium canariense TaxID=189055 RepID=A0A9W9LFX7_9EURO|nr:beta transducin-like protein HET-D2Y [Penicillium canariense]KAJ5152812.1 beta transducin-like protein HET-D2Y [Penicillium canariense]
MTTGDVSFDHSTNSALQIGFNNGTVSTTINFVTEPSEALDRACLQDLRETNPIHDKIRIEQLKGGLFKDSYRWVLENESFKTWREALNGQLLWVTGDPGKGKTMLLCGIIDELRSAADKATLSYFFCQATDARLSYAVGVLRGLIFLLVTENHCLLSHVRKRYDNEGKQLFEDTNAWAALSGILKDILEDKRLRSTYIIIDALDECGTDLLKLLDFIATKSSAYHQVKWIVSSRNWPLIEKRLKLAQNSRLCLELNELSVSDAVRVYIQHKVSCLAQRNEYDSDTKVRVQRHLTSHANHTFLWVALVCEQLADVSSWEVEEQLTTFPSDLRALYERMMGIIDQSRKAKLCKDILALMVTVYRPLTLDELSPYVDLPSGSSGNYRMLTEIIRLCGSILTLRDGTIYFVHQSAKDFLVASPHRVLPLGIDSQHRTILTRSLQTMQKKLRHNVYNIPHPGHQIEQIKQPIPDPLAATRYGCIYWVEHLLNGDPDGNPELHDDGGVHLFLRQRYLHWLEALSLLREFSAGITAMVKLESLLQIEGHSDSVTSIVWSQDGTQIASASYDETAKIWDSTTGQCVSTVSLQGVHPTTSPIAWSPDQARFASMHSDSIINIWNSTGECLQKLHASGIVDVISWSSNGLHLASGLEDGTIQIWDPARASECIQLLQGHTDMVFVIDWFSDGMRLASHSPDKTVRIWDPITGKCLRILAGRHFESGDCQIRWSYDGSQLATFTSFTSTIRIWDPSTGKGLRVLKGHGDDISALAWSADGEKLASGSKDRTVRIWNPVTGDCILTLEGHESWVDTLSWSHNGSRLASSSDGVIRIWDPALTQSASTLERHEGVVKSISWSPDRSRLASASDRTVRVWHPATGRHLFTLAPRHEGIERIAWSPDGRFVATADGSYPISIWSMATRECLEVMDRGVGVHAICWSDDGCRLASAASDKTARIWDPATGRCLQILEHSTEIQAISWSHDGSRLASSCWSARCHSAVMIWEAATGVCLQTMEWHGAPAGFLAWSYDGCRLASAPEPDPSRSSDSVIIWDATAGRRLHTLEGKAFVDVITWFPDGSRLATASEESPVFIWNTSNGHCIAKFRFGSTVLQFDKLNPNYLHTSVGTFDLASLPSTVDAEISAWDWSPSPPQIGYGLNNEQSWITYKGINLLRLPSEFRPTSVESFMISGSIVSIGCLSGRVLIFSLSHNPIINNPISSDLELGILIHG